MADIEEVRQIIRRTLTDYANTRYAYGDFHNETVFDEKSDRYLVVSAGWDGPRRVHGCLIHVDIRDGKVWIERDGTEDGIANDLVAAGIPREQIVPAFHPAHVRPHTGFAVA